MTKKAPVFCTVLSSYKGRDIEDRLFFQELSKLIFSHVKTAKIEKIGIWGELGFLFLCSKGYNSNKNITMEDRFLKNIFQEINKYTNNFRKYWLQYIALFIELIFLRRCLLFRFLGILLQLF